MKKIASIFLSLVFIISMINFASSDAVLPADLTIIESQAFENNTSIGHVTLPDGLKRIESRAFAGSTVGSIYMPESLEFIASDAFDECKYVTAWGASGTYAENWCIEHGVQYDAHNVPETIVVNWSDVEGTVEAAGLEGQFVELTNTGLMMWLPTVFQAEEVPEELAAMGMQCGFQTADGSAQIAVSLYQMNEGTGLAEYAAALEAGGATEIDFAVLNGLNAFSAKLVDENSIESAIVALEVREDYVAQVIFGPMSDESFAAISLIIVASIQPLA